MEKTVPAFNARRQFGKLVQDVLTHKDRFIVERHGEPVAALVPIEVYEQWKKARRAFFTKVQEAAARANLLPSEAEALVDEAVQAVRSTTKP